MNRKIIAWITALVLMFSATAVTWLSSPNTANAWSAPVVTPMCRPDANHNEFNVKLVGDEANYKFQWRYNQDDWATVDGNKGDNDLVTPANDGTLYVRWYSDHGSMASAEPNTKLCSQPTPTPTEKPTPKPIKVTLCHATASNNNPYVEVTVSVHSIATAQDLNGHGQHMDDIIPPFTWEDYSFPGRGDQSILASNCEVPNPTPTPTEKPTPTPTATPTPTSTPVPTDTPTPTKTPGPTDKPTPPQTSTLPVNDTPMGTDSASLLLVLGGLGFIIVAFCVDWYIQKRRLARVNNRR